MNFIGRRRSLPHRNKGKSRRKEEHSLYPWVCRLFVEKHVHTKHNKYDVNQKHEHVDESVSENILVESEYFLFLFKIRYVPS
jgi:hypothetical protein